MSVRLDGATVRLEGTCPVEDAEPLLALLQQHEGAAVDLASCGRIHAAVLQVLLAADRAVHGMPDDPFLARWVLPLLAARAASAQAIDPL